VADVGLVGDDGGGVNGHGAGKQTIGWQR
jgi:hypothetical protein